MNLQDMISKMSPQMLSQGLKQISKTLTPEQLSQAEAAIKGMSDGSLQKQLKALDSEQLSHELQNNPNLAKQLAQNPELLKALTAVISKK